jgi:hypothetical protein
MEKKVSITPVVDKDSTVMDTNDSKVDEIPDKDFKIMIIRMSNEIKEEANKFTNEFQENINKKLKK